MSISEFYSISAKDSTIGSHHTLWEVKQTPERAKTSNLLLYGKAGSEARELEVGSRAYTCPKRSGHAKRRGKSKINFTFLLPKPPHTHTLSLTPPNHRG